MKDLLLGAPFVADGLGLLGEAAAFLAFLLALAGEHADVALGGFLVEIGLRQVGGGGQHGALAIGQAGGAMGQALPALLVLVAALVEVAGQVLVLGAQGIQPFFGLGEGDLGLGAGEL